MSLFSSSLVTLYTSSRRRPGSCAHSMKIPACAGMTMLFGMVALLLSIPAASAADYVFTPKDCEFRMNFPEAPAPGQSCDEKDPKDCHAVNVYTKIYDASTGLRVTVTCGPAKPGMMEKYSGTVMQYTLGAMAKEHIDAASAQTGFDDEGVARHAILMGSKKQEDGSDSVYMSQLWIGKKSVFTVEGEITGPQLADADTLFAHIMKSARHESKDAAPAPVAAPDKPIEKPDEKAGAPAAKP